MRPRPRQLFVEGGGDHNSSLASECRKAFHKLLDADGHARKPRVVACGGRRRAYDVFCKALAAGDVDAWLLVDAEDPVAPTSPPAPRTHVKTRPEDGWARPPGATDGQLHFMAVCTETWLLADPEALRAVFGRELELGKLLAPDPALEAVPKPAAYAALAAATRGSAAGRYSKGSHSFKALERVRPERLRALPWAARFLDALRATPS